MIDFILVAPHGDEIIDPKDEKSALLNKAMKEAASLINADEYVVITPHNIRIDDHFAVILTQYAEGKLGKIRRKYLCDRKLAYKIYENAKRKNLPVVGVNFGALEGKESKITLDWGSLIPLYFLKKKKIVLLTPARGVKRESLIDFGMTIGEVLDYRRRRKIALIVSADHAHTHDPKGPYGFSEYAKVYDSLILDIFKRGVFENLKRIDDKIISEAKPDSYWQLLIMLGILENAKKNNKEYSVNLIEYQVPSYFGMMVALLK
ncbi:extradiol dioxygenase [Acidianus sulfidivorans JP7]|uniref:Extradiol dioxygenase n=1 Tax=Acidianus sulfidivorans JP7 TaxID=619593 RepID=A0A2U9IJX9_9CREN|nr:extradiol dioxygenase [Acidianus sulfidivorans]AWR96224.1 extradiol dioxygenase [Acidianus sulfidivorans JP7]